MKITNPFRRNSKTEPDDLGFGTQVTEPGERLINRDGSFNILRRGLRTYTPYQWLVEMNWLPFFVLVTLFFIAVNALFALGFVWIGIDQLEGIEAGQPLRNFARCFFFSVQTFTTVGYGAIHPTGAAANLLASFDALVGLLSFALATGLLFARFSKPRAMILFSRQALISPHRGGRAFMFRIANRRNNNIIDLKATLTMTWVDEQDGTLKRRFAPMKLERDFIVLFPLNWTLVHYIDQESPLFGFTEKELKRCRAEFLILIEGFDETFAQQVHTNSSYTWKEVQWKRKFEPMFESRHGRTVLQLDRIDHTVPVDWEEE